MTKRFAVIGDPVEHSMSPVMHNAVFKRLGLDCVFEKVRIPKGKLGDEFDALREKYAGLSITIPHKIAIMPLLDRLDEKARLVGAVNCVDFKSGDAVGYNTDIAGAVDSLKIITGSLKGKKILILGAGGAARAIVFGCALEGAKVAIWNRTKERAIELMQEVMRLTKAKSWEIEGDSADVIINATSVGMSPNADRIPIRPELLERHMTVMDIVYNPLETKLLKEAKKIGCKTIDGVEMLVRQGAEALRIWLDIDAPLEVMRKTVLEELKRAGKGRLSAD